MARGCSRQCRHAQAELFRHDDPVLTHRSPKRRPAQFWRARRRTAGRHRANLVDNRRAVLITRAEPRFRRRTACAGGDHGDRASACAQTASSAKGRSLAGASVKGGRLITSALASSEVDGRGLRAMGKRRRCFRNRHGHDIRGGDRTQGPPAGLARRDCRIRSIAAVAWPTLDGDDRRVHIGVPRPKVVDKAKYCRCLRQGTVR